MEQIMQVFSCICLVLPHGRGASLRHCWFRSNNRSFCRLPILQHGALLVEELNVDDNAEDTITQAALSCIKWGCLNIVAATLIQCNSIMFHITSCNRSWVNCHGIPGPWFALLPQYLCGWPTWTSGYCYPLARDLVVQLVAAMPLDVMGWWLRMLLLEMVIVWYFWSAKSEQYFTG